MVDSKNRPVVNLGACGPHQSLLEKYVENFDLAEQRIKKTENGTRSFQDAAINELRYAARHVIQAMSPQTVRQEDDSAEALNHDDVTIVAKEPPAARELRRANDHCLRARYDAIEVEALYYLEAIEKFLDDYRLVPLDGELQATYIAASKHAKSASDFTNRPSGVGDDRPKRLAELDEHSTMLKGALDQCEACRVPLNNRILDLRNKDKRSVRQWKTMAFIAFLAAMAGWAKVAADRTKPGPSVKAPSTIHT